MGDPHRRSWRRSALGADRARTEGCGRRAGPADRRGRCRQRVRGAVGPRRPAGQPPQRRPGRDRGAAGGAAGVRQRGALRHPDRPAPGRRPGRGRRPARSRRPRRLAACLGRGPPALGRRAGPALRPLPRRGGGRGPLGAGVRLQPVAGGAGAAAVPVPRRARRGRLPSPARHRGRPGPLRPAGGRAGARRLGSDQPRAGHDRAARFFRLLPGGVGHHVVLPQPRHLLPGPGVGRQLGGVLRAGHHQRGLRGAGAAVRAVPVARAGRPARHRHRYRERPARGGDPVRVRPLRPGPHRPGGQRDRLPGPLRGARRGQGAGASTRPPGRLGQIAGPLRRLGRAGRSERGRCRGPQPWGHPRRRAGAGRGRRGRAPASGHPLRGDGDLRPARRRGVPGGVGVDGRPVGAAVGQGRLRGGGPGQVRPAGTGDALGAALRGGPGGLSPRRAHRPGRPAPGPRRVRHAVRGRHGGRVPGGVESADGHPAPAAAPLLLRPGGGGGADPARADPGRLGPSLHPAPQRSGAGHLPASAAGAVAGQDAGGAAVPGAANADGHRRGRVHPGGVRRAAPGHGGQALGGAHAAAARPILRRDGRARHRHRRGRADLAQDGGLRQLRVPREPLGVVRLPGVRLGVDQAALPGRVLRGAAERPADGLLLAPLAVPGRPPPRGGGARTRHQPVGRWGRAGTVRGLHRRGRGAPGPVVGAGGGSRAGRGHG